MLFSVNYEHVFFDRYELTEIEKRNEVTYIIGELLKKLNCTFDSENMTVKTDESSFEAQAETEKVFEIMKNEFFVILEETEENPREDAPKTDVEEIVDYLNKKYLHENLTVKSVCDRFNVSRGQIDDMLVKACSKTASEYIRWLRVNKAKELLDENMTVKETADTCGFGSEKTMQRAFKAELGITPGEWKGRNLDSKAT